MTNEVRRLLDQYPPSFVKSDAIRLLQAADRPDDSARPLKFAVYDIVYAFQRLEARRLGIRPDRQPDEYAQFRHNYIAALAMWVPGKNPLADKVRAAIDAHAAGATDEVTSILEELLRATENHHSSTQARSASAARKLKTIDRYILALLADRPTLSEKELWQQIERDSEDMSCAAIGELEPDGVWVIDPTPEERVRSDFYTRTSFRSRLSRLKRKNISH
jgi:hypothetical protein